MSTPSFQLLALLTEHGIAFEQPSRARSLTSRLLHAVKAKELKVLVTVEKYVKRRSNKQNAWEWSCALPLMLADSGYELNEMKQAKEDLHYALIAKCFGTHYDARLKAEVPKVRSSNLTTEQYSYYMGWLQRHAAQEWLVIVPDPDSEWMFKDDGEKPAKLRRIA